MAAEKSGGPVSYYLVQVDKPNQGTEAYQAECGDIIEALGMTFNEGCAFKAIWRSAAARTLGKLKDGGDAIYDAQKVQFYGKRMEVCLKPPAPKVLPVAAPEGPSDWVYYLEDWVPFDSAVHGSINFAPNYKMRSEKKPEFLPSRYKA